MKGFYNLKFYKLFFILIYKKNKISIDLLCVSFDKNSSDRKTAIEAYNELKRLYLLNIYKVTTFKWVLIKINTAHKYIIYIFFFFKFYNLSGYQHILWFLF